MTVIQNFPAAVHAIHDPSVTGPYVQVTWANTPDNEQSFTVQQSDDGGSTWATIVTEPADVTETKVPVDELHAGQYIYRVFARDGGGKSSTTQGGPVNIGRVLLIGGRNQNNGGGGMPEDAGIKKLHDLLISKEGGFSAKEVSALLADESNPAARQANLTAVENLIIAIGNGAKGQAVSIALVGYSWGGGLLYAALQELQDTNRMPSNVTVVNTTYIDAVVFGKVAAVLPLDIEKFLNGVVTKPETDYPAFSQKHYDYYQSELDFDLTAAALPHGDATPDAVNFDLDMPGSENGWVPNQRGDTPKNHKFFTQLTIDNDLTLHHKIDQNLKAAFGRQ